MDGFSIGHFADVVTHLIAQFKDSLPLLGRVFAVLWGVHFVNMMLGMRLTVLGIYPRHWFSLPGIIWAPLLHANFEHLISNCLILMILITMISVQGEPLLLAVTFVVALLGGFATWCFGRPAIHIGASGVAMGYWGYILVSAYKQPGLITIAAATVGVYYLGGLAANLLPTGHHDSWESHLFGFIAGCIAGGAAPWLLTQPWFLHAAMAIA